MNLLNVLRGLKKIQAGITPSQKFGTDFLANGDLIEYDGDAITPGNQIFLKSAAGDYSVLADGAYKTKTSNITFNYKDGVVETVTAPTKTETENTPSEPIQQAQSKTESKETPTDPKENLKVILADANVTVDISTVISSALNPIWDAIYAIQTAIDNLAMLYVSQDCFSKTQDEVAKTIEMSVTKTDEVKATLIKVSEKLEKIAKTPATEPIEGSANQFNKTTNKETSKGYSRIMDILNSKD